MDGTESAADQGTAETRYTASHIAGLGGGILYSLAGTGFLIMGAFMVSVLLMAASQPYLAGMGHPEWSLYVCFGSLFVFLLLAIGAGAWLLRSFITNYSEYVMDENGITTKRRFGSSEFIPFNEIKMITYHPGYELRRGKGPVVSIFYGTEPSKCANLGFAKMYAKTFERFLNDLRQRLPDLAEKGLIRQGEYPY
ncbi:MAG: hypothetical protein PHF60_00655 [Candidatus ainarchaeum sp.]|nr:hypothetical protein [Candidatus ainarchaeum sp.]